MRWKYILPSIFWHIKKRRKRMCQVAFVQYSAFRIPHSIQKLVKDSIEIALIFNCIKSSISSPHHCSVVISYAFHSCVNFFEMFHFWIDPVSFECVSTEKKKIFFKSLQFLLLDRFRPKYEEKIFLFSQHCSFHIVCWLYILLRLLHFTLFIFWCTKRKLNSAAHT